jgi:hypothetical protein
LVSTLEAILTGPKKLFENQWIHESDYSWEPNPVIRLSLDNIDITNEETAEFFLLKYIKDIALENNMYISTDYTSLIFIKLIEFMNENRAKKVAILIDDYGAPIANAIDKEGLFSLKKISCQS